MNELIGTDIAAAAELIRRGEVVAIPTETVYGLAGDAFNSQAVARIFAAKNRPSFDPLIVHLANPEWLVRVVHQVEPLARVLIDQFWPGPLTLVFEKHAAISELVTSGLPSVAVRMPDHQLTLELLRVCNTPLAAPSANLFGRTSPTTAAHVASQLSDRIAYILDGGPCTVGIESTIVRVTDGRIRILRPGGITREQLLGFGPVDEGDEASDATTSPNVPGQLPEHYAPQTPLRIIEPRQAISIEAATGIIALQNSQLPLSVLNHEHVVIEELSPSGDLTEAAAGFFAAIHRLDARQLRRLLAVRFPDEGLGIALNDRLTRAAHKSVNTD